MKPVGKPDAGNPHVRFDERRLETELWHELRHRHGRKPPANSTASQPTATAPVVDSIITKYRYKVLEGALRERIRTIIRQAPCLAGASRRT